MKNCLISIFVLLVSCFAINAQTKLENGVEINKIVHNFGDIMLGSGPVGCKFTLTNNSERPAIIYNVTTTCGCTDIVWTREPIRAGEKGEIKITYSNDEGPYPFDKSVTLYMSDLKKPVILKLRGVSVAKPRPMTEQFPVHYGPLGMKESEMKCGNLEQGGSKSNTVTVANLGTTPLKVSFTNVSEHLQVSLSRNPIPPGETSEMTFTVNSDRSLWGKNTYMATPVINGKTYRNRNGRSSFSVWAFTKENFSHMTDAERQKGPMPRFETSTYSFGKAKAGDQITASFTFKNEGKSDLRVYKVDTDGADFSPVYIPVASPGKEITFNVRIDTKGMKAGESMTIVTLTTNSPSRPIINLFISGILE